MPGGGANESQSPRKAFTFYGWRLEETLFWDPLVKRGHFMEFYPEARSPRLEILLLFKSMSLQTQDGDCLQGGYGLEVMDCKGTSTGPMMFIFSFNRS